MENQKLRKKCLKGTKINGITLIALVVTIVVLLILAGITINFVMSDNGIFKTAEGAKGKQKEAEYLEQIKIAVTNSRINENLKINTTVLENSLNNIQGISSIEKEDDENLPWIVSTNDGYKFKIKGDGTVEAVSGITLSQTSLNLEQGDEVTLTVSLTEGVSGTVTWTSSNEEVATVDSNGKVTAITNNGTATITAQVNSNGKIHEATCIVKIEQTLASLVGKPVEQETTIEDKNGNEIVIPAGFTVVANSLAGTDASEKVTYSYNGDGTPAVQDGIVVQDGSGNQFVWIPIGDIKNKDGTTTKIELARYTFGTSNGNPTTVQKIENYATPTNLRLSGETWDYQELVGDSENTGARSLSNFYTKTNANGGYYLARYEASRNGSMPMSKANQSPWVKVTQSNAATYCKNYTTTGLESDLVNSYAWDTAIVFIEKCTTYTNYANEKRTGSSALNTGKSGDVACNIHDMASNCWEWSTEHCTRADSKYEYPCVSRSGYSNIYRWRFFGVQVSLCLIRFLCRHRFPSVTLLGSYFPFKCFTRKDIQYTGYLF